MSSEYTSSGDSRHLPLKGKAEAEATSSGASRHLPLKGEGFEDLRGAALEVIREIIEQDTDADVIYDRIIGVIVLEKKLEAQHGHV